jgi:hypothetical protein
VRRNTTPSRSRRQTTAFTAAGRRYGALKYKRPLVPSFKPGLARTSASPVGIFAQPSPYSVSVYTADDRVAENVPAPDGRFHRDLRVVRILHWVDQLPTTDSKFSVSRFRYPVEGKPNYAHLRSRPRLARGHRASDPPSGGDGVLPTAITLSWRWGFRDDPRGARAFVCLGTPPEPGASARGILWPMPSPFEERDTWKRELREELPALMATHQQELAAGTPDEKRREWLEWQIRRVRKRMADLEARLAKDNPDRRF